jgi:type VI secretion system protein ImpK
MFVVGHTDADPPKKSKAKYPDNHALSYARAKSVTAELKAVGIDTKRMIPSGAGETSPVAAGTGAKEKEKNRRVEIWID